MKKHLLLTAIVLALVLCFSCGIFAADITSDKDNPNQYLITEKLQNFTCTDDLWIGTLADWKAEGKTVGDTGTVFVNGEAINDDDIIITNGKVGAVLAVGTRNPWGYPAGSILDVGTVSEMKGGRDTVWSIELLVNGWDSWAPENCGVVKFDVVKYDFKTKAESATGLDAIKVSRIYNVGGNKFDVVTYYGIEKGAEIIMMFDQLTNTTGADTTAVSNRVAMTNKGDDGGAMKGIKSTTMISTYGNTEKNKYMTSCVLPGKNTSNKGIDHAWGKNGGSVGYMELRAGVYKDAEGNYVLDDGEIQYGQQIFFKDESVTYDEYIIVSDEPTTEATNDFLMNYYGTEKMAVSGTVKDAAGKAVAEPVIVVEKNGSSYGWYMGDKDGKFAFNLPAEAGFTAYVERDGYAPGTAAEITLNNNKAVELNLVSGAAKEKITFTLKDAKGNPVYGKVELFDANGKSVYPTVRFCGDSVYQANKIGKIETEIAPGEYKAVVYGEGYWFYSNPVEVKKNTADGNQTVVVDVKYSLGKGWLAGDLHHHANKNDAFADPADAIPSMKAAGLDVAFVTDHDFTVNNAKAYELAKEYNMAGFIPSEEISCSWAHFNVIPLDEESYAYFKDDKAENHVMNQFAQLPVFVKQTHDAGAAITANHPWYSYGLFYADYYESIPGGYTDDYDNIEINACNSETDTFDTIISGTELWTAYTDATSWNNMGDAVTTKKPHYIVGGSDTHDVLYPGFAGSDYTNVRGAATYASGKIRTIAYIGEESSDVTENGLAFANAVVNGKSYTTFGPLLSMNAKTLPGEYYNGKKFEVSFNIESLAEIKDILVLTEYADTAYEDFTGSDFTDGRSVQYDAEASKLNVGGNEATFTYTAEVPEGEFSWVAFLVVDVNGNFAITNPYWIANTFPDVDLKAWYAPAVTNVQQAGLIEGYPDGTFKPEGDITRAEFAVIMYRLMKDDEATEAVEASSFTDVSDKHWAKEAIDYLAANEVVNGYPDGTFKPEAKITRAEIAQIFYNAFGWGEYVKHFEDVQPGVWYYDAITALATVGIVNGYPDNTFLPNNNARRCEVAQIIYNLIGVPEVEQ